MKRIAIFTSTMFAVVFLYGQEKPAPADSFRTLEPVELRSTRAGENAPFTKTNLDKEAIQRNNWGADLPFLLNQVPGVVVNSDAGNGVGYTGIRIRGTDASRINVTLNGIPFNDAESQGTFFVNLPDFSSSVSSIQVQRGVGTSSNGPGSFGATINISTHENQTTPYLEFNNSFGSFNTWKNTLKVGSGLVGGHFTTDLRLSRISSDGFIDRASSRLESYYLSTAWMNKRSSLRFTHFAGKERTYQAWYGVSAGDLINNRTVNYAGTERPGEPYDNETDNYDQDHFQLFFQHELSPQWKFNTGLYYVKGKGYYEQYKAGEDYADYGLIPPVYGNDTVYSTDLVRQLWLDNDFYGQTFSVFHRQGISQLTLGGGWSRYEGNHFGNVIWAENGLGKDTRWYQHPALKTDLNIYVKEQVNFTRDWFAFVDLQYRGLRYEINGFRDSPGVHFNNNYRFFNPKAGLSYSNKKGWSAYASYSLGQKEPNRDDFEAGANQAPRPERLNDLEFNLGKKGSRFQWDATFYYMHYTDQLVLTGKINDVGAYTRTNIPRSYRMGIELNGGVKASKWLRVAANLALSRNKVLDFTEYLDDYDNGGQLSYTYEKSDIAFSPSIVGGATLAFTPNKTWEIDWISKYVSRQYLDNTQNKERSLDPFAVQDLRVSWAPFKKALSGTRILAQVNNVLDSKYEPNGYTFSYFYNGMTATENYYFPMAGRNFVFSINIAIR